MQIEAVDDDWSRNYSPEEEKLLTHNLTILTEKVRKKDCITETYSMGLISNWHKILFSGVRDHAGRFRTAHYGEEYLIFGPNRSAHRAEVESLLGVHERKVRGMIGDLADSPNTSTHITFVSDILKVAIWAHANLIKIHPFRDGNGRIGRLISTFIIRKFGLPALAIEVVKKEYIECLNFFYQTNDIDRLLGLYLRIYGNMFK